MKAFILIFILCFFSLPRLGFSNNEFCFKNDSALETNYVVYWFDHKLENWPGPFNIAGGRLNPTGEVCIGPYPPGDFSIVWQDQDRGYDKGKPQSVPFIIKEDNKIITVTRTGKISMEDRVSNDGWISYD